MLKKITIISISCLVASLIGMAATTPFAVRETINSYNSIVQKNEGIVTETVISDPVTKLRIVGDGHYSVQLTSSLDNKIYISMPDNGFYKQNAKVNIVGDEAVVSISVEENLTISKEKIEQAVLVDIMGNYLITVAVPENISITSTKSDRIHFNFDDTIKFKNSDILRQYDYYLSPDEIIKIELDKEKSIGELNKIIQEKQNQIESLQAQLEEEIPYNPTTEESEEYYGFEQPNWMSNYEIEEDKNIIAEYVTMLRQESITREVYDNLVDPVYQEIKEERISLAEQNTLDITDWTIIIDKISSISDKLRLIDEELLNQSPSKEKIADIMVSIKSDQNVLNEFGLPSEDIFHYMKDFFPEIESN